MNKNLLVLLLLIFSTFFAFLSAQAQLSTIELRSGQGEIGEEDPITSVRIVDPAPPTDFFPAIIIPRTTVIPIGTSQTISTDNEAPPGGTVCEAEFVVTFELPFNFSSPSLTLLVAADDSGGVFLNGHRIGGDPLGGSAVQIETSDSTIFLPGENTLSFLIRNQQGGSCPFFDLSLIYEATISFEETFDAQVRILSPNDGTVFCERRTTVTGEVAVTPELSEASIACQVNNIAATIVDNAFEALVPLSSRNNTITATCTVTDTAGIQVSAFDEINVFLDTRRPTCNFSSESGAVVGRFIDRHSGIASVEAIEIKNGQLIVDDFEPGDREVAFRLEVVDPNKSMSFSIDVTDVCGNTFNCDPVFLNLSLNGSVQQYEFTFPSVDRYFEITNAGLSEVRIDLNGNKFKLMSDAAKTSTEFNAFTMPLYGKLKFDMAPYLNSELNSMSLIYDGPEASSAEVFISDFSDNVDFELTLQSVPGRFKLAQNYPNPFNPTTKIRFDIPDASFDDTNVRIRIYNLAGELVRTLVDGQKAPGQYTVEWDGKNDAGHVVTSSIYIYQLVVDEFKESRRMILMK